MADNVDEVEGPAGDVMEREFNGCNKRESSRGSGQKRPKGQQRRRYKEVRKRQGLIGVSGKRDRKRAPPRCF